MSYNIVEGIRAIGRSEFIKSQKGEKLTQRQAIKAFCYQCTGGYSGGARDCLCFDCPIYRFHPYQGKNCSDNARTDA